MSHTTTIEAAMQDPGAVRSAVEAVGGRIKNSRTAQLFDGTVHAGTVIELPGWSYPVIITAGGELAYDNYGGTWGDIEVLNRFRREYTAAVVSQEMGAEWEIEREQLASGDLRLTLVAY